MNQWIDKYTDEQNSYINEIINVWCKYGEEAK